MMRDGWGFDDDGNRVAVGGCDPAAEARFAEGEGGGEAERLGEAAEFLGRIVDWIMGRRRGAREVACRAMVASYQLGRAEGATLETLGRVAGVSRAAMSAHAVSFSDSFGGFRSPHQKTAVTREKLRASHLGQTAEVKAEAGRRRRERLAEGRAPVGGILAAAEKLRRAGLTWGQVAGVAGVPERTMRDWRNGSCGPRSRREGARALRALEEALGRMAGG